MDQCMHCTSRGNSAVCAKTACGKHDDWITMDIRQQVTDLTSQNTALKQVVAEREDPLHYGTGDSDEAACQVQLTDDKQSTTAWEDVTCVGCLCKRIVELESYDWSERLIAEQEANAGLYQRLFTVEQERDKARKELSYYRDTLLRNMMRDARREGAEMIKTKASMLVLSCLQQVRTSDTYHTAAKVVENVAYSIRALPLEEL